MNPTKHKVDRLVFMKQGNSTCGNSVIKSCTELRDGSFFQELYFCLLNVPLLINKLFVQLQIFFLTCHECRFGTRTIIIIVIIIINY